MNFFARVQSPKFHHCYDSAQSFSSNSSYTGSTTSLNDDMDKIEDNTNDMADYQLKSKWNFYYLKSDPTLPWDERVQHVASFSTVKEFWSVYLHLKLPNFLPQGADYMVFRDGIKPEWQDENNKEGGRWLMEIDRFYRNEQLNNKWLETLLAVIGEQLEDNPTSESESEICGAIVQSRKKVDRVVIWTRHAENYDMVRNIGLKYRDKLAPRREQRLKYQSHESSQNRSSSHFGHQIML